jgi:hypothetical protein
MFNNLFANQQFIPAFLRRYGVLGPINANLQRMLSAFYQFKKHRARAWPGPNLVEFYDMVPLRDAEKLFYEAGLTAHDALAVLDRHLDRLKEFARYIIAHIYASTLGDPRVLTNGPFVTSLDLRTSTFDPSAMAARYAEHADSGERYPWTLNPDVLAHFIQVHAGSPPLARQTEPELARRKANGAIAVTEPS